MGALIIRTRCWVCYRKVLTQQTSILALTQAPILNIRVSRILTASWDFLILEVSHNWGISSSKSFSYLVYNSKC